METVATIPSVEYVRPWMYDLQRDAVFAPERYSIIEASTKSGKTVGCIIWLTEQALAGRRGQHFWWIAPVYPQAAIAYNRLKLAMPRALYKANETDLMITLSNGAIIEFKSAEKPDNLFGEDVYAAVIDEASRVREEAWHAIRTTLTATRGPVRIIGNVKGRKNWAYHLARKAESGETDMAYFRITAYDAIKAGVLDQEEIEDAKRQLPEATFRELYLAEPTDDEGNPFGLSAIHACLAPLSADRPSWWGWDLAKSIDWTVGIALDRSKRACRFERFQQPWGSTMLRIRTNTEQVPALVDASGVGDPIVEELRKSAYNIKGFLFSQQSKQQLMEGLAVAIQRQLITIPAEPAMVNEIEAFEYEYTRTGVRYAAPEGMHDDTVIALALAVQCAATSFTMPSYVRFKIDRGPWSPYNFEGRGAGAQQGADQGRTFPSAHYNAGVQGSWMPGGWRGV